jgi:outer membrane protein TolC
VKGQKLFSTLLPGVTAAVLTTQPVWANTVSNKEIEFHTDLTAALFDNLTKLKTDFTTTIDSNFDGISKARPWEGIVPSQVNRCINQQGKKKSRVSAAALLSSNPVCVLDKGRPKTIAQGNNLPRNFIPQVPDNLIPNPNPLQFPVRPDDVRVENNQAISLSQAWELARRNNKQLQAAQLELDRSHAGLRQAQATLLPSLTVSTSLSRSQSAGGELQFLRGRNFNLNGTDVPSTDFSGQLQLSYGIYTSGRQRATVREAEEQIRNDELELERLSEEIRLNVATQYYDLQAADESVRIAQSAVKNAEASLKDALALEKAGVGTKFDVLRFQVNLANAQQDLTTSRSQQRIASRRLANILSLPQSANVTAAEKIQIAGLWQLSLEDSITTAFQGRPELQQQLVQRNINEQRRRQALSQLGPQVNLVASYDVIDQFQDRTRLVDGYSLGVRASLNLYDGGDANARAQQAKIGIAVAETNFANTRNQIRLQVEEAYNNLSSNRENINTATTALGQATEALRLAQLRFKAGVGTQTEVIAAENDLTRADGSRTRAIIDYNRALVSLQRAVFSTQVR